MTSRPNCTLKLSWLFEVAGVSKSGYYEWLNNVNKREQRELKDRADFNLILQAYKHRGYDKGAKGVKMQLLRSGVNMNLKKIRRLMHKYNLVCPIRKIRPYRQTLKSQNVFAPNILKREFRSYGPRMVLLTDISYIPYGHGDIAYLSVVKDAHTKQILSDVLSPNLREEFVLKTFIKLNQKYGNEISSSTIVHSDQGAHYMSIDFSKILQRHDIIQSMSRRANCWDNAPQESFFGHMKDEIDLSKCKEFGEVKEIIDDWMDYYNNERYQWNLAKLSPNEYYEYITTGIYPLK